MAKVKKPVVQFAQVLEALQDARRPFPPVHLNRFSDLTGNNLAQFKNVWGKVDPDRRAALLEDLEDLADADTVVNFDEVAKFGLNDPDPRVRATSLRLLWETDDRRLIPEFIRIMEKDADSFVRASAATALGSFVYQGELEQLPPEILHKVEDALLVVAKGEEVPLVRRRALESLGFSSREEVPAMIRSAYQSADKEWQASALFAMGRSADETWEKEVMARLDSTDSEIQLEAVRAAGELDLKAARQWLVTRLENPADLDEDVRIAAAWSLSQIGGEDARETLEKLLEETEDEDEADFIDMAIENLAFTEDLPGFGMFDAIKNIEDHTQIIDLEEPLDDEEDEGDLPDEEQKFISKN